MTDKIKSEDFIKAFGSGESEHHITTENNDAFPMGIVAGKCPIEAGGNCPLRPQGQWVEIERQGRTGDGRVFTFPIIVCSNCGEQFDLEGEKFCPHCGACMRGEEE